jgi:hypothetical protein
MQLVKPVQPLVAWLQASAGLPATPDASPFALVSEERPGQFAMHQGKRLAL